MIDLDALEAGIAEGEKKNFFVAPIVKELIAELRHARGERAAVVAWLDAHLNLEWCDCCGQRGTTISEIANAIERGEHRREEG